MLLFDRQQTCFLPSKCCHTPSCSNISNQGDCRAAAATVLNVSAEEHCDALRVYESSRDSDEVHR